ncbi:hypothetical protein BD311DRAFT_865870 [Dichomitus squalens]|uniref:MYND-type domain-containing protein n=1 Tax=Dichomitus squalens TaxID=114155 RepID=A0A4Q9MJU6_9APHY|nr:hypothetical protein BD311DRAFT_865870 [Dichomitus squalens]
MDPLSLRRLERERFAAQFTDPTIGRQLDELVKSNDILSGTESQRLRSYFSNNGLEPARHLDIYGRAIMMGDLESIKLFYNASLDEYGLKCDSGDTARAAATREIYEKRWGPTRVPVYNLILLSTLIMPPMRRQHLEVARWLIDEAKVPVDGKDLSGSTALHHAISTKPAFDPEYAQMLYDAGGIVTLRNRYGGTPAHEIVMTWDPTNREAVRKAADALKWYLDHGGNLEIKDSDGVAVRHSVNSTKNFARKGIQMETWRVVDTEDRRRANLAGKICTFCGREPGGDVRLLLCSKCRVAHYCSGGRPCQKADWPYHKSVCKATPTA